MKFILLFIAIFIYPLANNAQTAMEIVKKADQKRRGETSVAEMVIKTVRPDWSREMKMKVWTKNSKYAMILITSPDREKGTVFLKRGNEVWNWKPQIQRSIKLPPSMMTQSWMGTDFTNDDLVEQSSIVEDYEHEILKDSIIDGRNCWKVQLKPKPDAAVVWGKIYTWIEKEDYLELRSEFYDEDGYLINIMKASEIKTFDNRKLPSKLEMIPVDKKRHKTIMTYSSITFNEPIEDKFFTLQNMKRLR